jgi:hypothetical protein
MPPRPLVALMGVSRPFTETLPTGASTLAPLIPPTTASAVVSPLSFNFLGSRSTLICFFALPIRSTLDTPSTSSTEGTTSSSAYLVKSARSPSLAASESDGMGNCEAD